MGAVQRTGKIGYLPQDPRTGEDQGTVIERILSARDLDQIAARMTQVEEEMATTEGAALEKAMERYTRVDAEFQAAGGYAATAEAEAIATSLGVSEAVFGNQLDTLYQVDSAVVLNSRAFSSLELRHFCSMSQRTT